MSKIKRKPRKKLIKGVDLLIPLDLSKIGTEDDPCFGKHYAPASEECSRCGDNEVCSIAMMQVNHLKRAELEATNKFKDVEEEGLEQKVSKEEVKKQVKKRIRELVKLSGKKGITKDAVIADVNAMYFRDGFTKTRLAKIIKLMVEKSNHILETKNQLTWKA